MYKLVVFLLVIIISANVFADDNIITQNMPNACYVDMSSTIKNIHHMSAVWQPKLYTCEPGYYLPANSVECAKCAPDHNCPGGTYHFDEKQPHGIGYNTILSQNASDTCIYEYLWPDVDQTIFKAIWQINTYTCAPGYYLPADGVECVICPNNNYCPGGTYTYSETDVQGITECPIGLISPIGVSDAGGCGYKLHIGDDVIYLRSQKKTSPLINVDIDGDGVPDFFGNLTPKKTFMNRDSNLFLHVGDYYMYDDSITPGE